MALNRRPRRVEAIGGVIETMAAGRAGVRPTADGAAVAHTRARHWARLFEFESWIPSAVLGCPLAEAPLAMSAAPFARTKHSPQRVRLWISNWPCGSRENASPEACRLQSQGAPALAPRRRTGPRAAQGGKGGADDEPWSEAPTPQAPHS